MSAAAHFVPFNIDTLFTRCLKNADIVAQVLAAFEAEVVADFKVIEEGLASHNIERIATAAHSLKGAAAMLSAETLCLALLKLERAVRAGDLADAGNDVAQIRTELHRCIAYLPIAREQLSAKSRA